jgi:hypothetical protein
MVVILREAEEFTDPEEESLLFSAKSRGRGLGVAQTCVESLIVEAPLLLEFSHQDLLAAVTQPPRQRLDLVIDIR